MYSDDQFEQLKVNVQQAMAEHWEDRRARVNAREERLIALGKELNDDRPPTIGKDDRYHAPCDGYEWTWETGSHQNGTLEEHTATFMAGEFLPVSRDDLGDSNILLATSQPSAPRGSYKITYVEVEISDRLIKLLQDLTPISKGTDFKDYNTGKQISHLYVGYRCAADLVEAFIEAPKIAERKAAQEKADAERESAANCPEGRVDIVGEIVSVKMKESMYGSVLKMLVVDDTGFKVWGTVPSSIEGCLRGDTISFSAQVTPSDDDAKFGFFKRPTKASILEGEQA